MSEDMLLITKGVRRGGTYRPDTSSVLQQVRSFLPKMAAAQTELETRLQSEPPSVVDIENVEGCEGPIIEMNLALVEADDSDDDSSLATSEDDSSTSDEDSADDVANGENATSDVQPCTVDGRKFITAKRRRVVRPVIEEISSGTDALQTGTEAERGSVQMENDSRDGCAVDDIRKRKLEINTDKELGSAGSAEQRIVERTDADSDDGS